MEALRPKLSIKGIKEDRPEVTSISGPPSPRLSKVLGEIVATAKISRRRSFEHYLCLESVFASSEQLDVPFAYHLNHSWIFTSLDKSKMPEMEIR
ncbi:hypothetical protein AAEP93_004248 [Penicillium crustosum]